MVKDLGKERNDPDGFCLTVIIKSDSFIFTMIVIIHLVLF